MSVIRSAAVLFAAWGLLLIPAGQADAAIWCGDARAYYRENGTRQFVQASDIYADEMKCQQAKRVARKWASKSRLSISPAGSVGRFRCHYFRIGSDVGTTVCWKRGGKAKLLFGAYDSSPFH